MSDAFISRLDAAGYDIFEAEILQDSETLLHYAPKGNVRYPIYSAAKSVTSAAFSLACDDGLLSPDMPLAEFIETKYAPLMSGEFRRLPFQRFLTMTAGSFPFRPSGEDWIAGILALGTDHSDTAFHYSNIPAYLVGAAVENSVGGDLMKYLGRRLFGPLGIPEPAYSRSPEGHFYGATGMELSAAELARIGQLYLNSGCYEGTQLISKASVKAALTPYTDTGSCDSYGFFFRIAEDHFSIVGKWGQRCIVWPERQLVIAYLSHQPERSEELYRTVRNFADELTGQRNPE